MLDGNSPDRLSSRGYDQPRSRIPELTNYAPEGLIYVGELAFRQFEQIMKDDSGFEPLFNQDGIVLQSQNYQTEEKYHIT